MTTIGDVTPRGNQLPVKITELVDQTQTKFLKSILRNPKLPDKITGVVNLSRDDSSLISKNFVMMI